MPPSNWNWLHEHGYVFKKTICLLYTFRLGVKRWKISQFTVTIKVTVIFRGAKLIIFLFSVFFWSWCRGNSGDAAKCSDVHSDFSKIFCETQTWSLVLKNLFCFFCIFPPRNASTSCWRHCPFLGVTSFWNGQTTSFVFFHFSHPESFRLLAEGVVYFRDHFCERFHKTLLLASKIWVDVVIISSVFVSQSIKNGKITQKHLLWLCFFPFCCCFFHKTFFSETSHKIRLFVIWFLNHSWYSKQF